MAQGCWCGISADLPELTLSGYRWQCTPTPAVYTDKLSANGAQLSIKTDFPPPVRPACHGGASWRKGNDPLFGNWDNREALLFTIQTVVSNSRFWTLQIIAFLWTFAFKTKFYIIHPLPSSHRTASMPKKQKVKTFYHLPCTNLWSLSLWPKAANQESKHTSPPIATILPRKWTHFLLYPALFRLLAEPHDH